MPVSVRRNFLLSFASDGRFNSVFVVCLYSSIGLECHASNVDVGSSNLSTGTMIDKKARSAARVLDAAFDTRETAYG